MKKRKFPSVRKHVVLWVRFCFYKISFILEKYISKRQQNAQTHTHIRCPKSTSCDDKPMIKTAKRVSKQTIQNGRKKRNGQALLHLPRRMFAFLLVFCLSVSLVMFFSLTLHEAKNGYVLQIHTTHVWREATRLTRSKYVGQWTRLCQKR